MHVLYVCALHMGFMYGLYVCALCMCLMYRLYVFALCMFYVVIVWGLCMCLMYVFYVFALRVCCMLLLIRAVAISLNVIGSGGASTCVSCQFGDLRIFSGWCTNRAAVHAGTTVTQAAYHSSIIP